MKYRIIDLDQRDAHEEMKQYTFEQVKDYFKPGDELAHDFPELLQKWEAIEDLFDLNDFLAFEAGGMEVHYSIECIE